VKYARRCLAAAIFSSSLPAHCADTVVEIAAPKAAVFHHLDASGRNNLAVSGASVALVWEDNRAGAPGCFLALKSGANAFREFSFGQGECFEPAITALDAERFLLIWEDAGGVHASLADAAGPGPATKLADSGGQGSVAFHAQLGAFAAWSATDGRWRRVWLAPLSIAGRQLHAGPIRPVDTAAASDDQTFPVLAAWAQGLTVAWEDRRHGHTVIYGSLSHDAKTWSAPTRISGNPTGKAQGNLGRGSGAMRPALAAFGGRLAAAWLDKRDFLSGYDVYAALTTPDGDGMRFGKDQKAQDSFGDAIAQWHVAVAGNARGELMLAWDDDRDGTADIWLTRLSGAGYSGDFTLPAASGAGQQSDPAIALDAAGNLHLAWIERGGDGATQVRYTQWLPPPTHGHGFEKAP
jgi:hypothetical protein